MAVGVSDHAEEGEADAEELGGGVSERGSGADRGGAVRSDVSPDMGRPNRAVHCPLEHREGCGLRLGATALGLHRLFGHELRPREQRLLRLRGLVVVDVAVGVATVPVDRGRHVAVGIVPLDRHKEVQMDDAICVAEGWSRSGGGG